MKINFFHKNIKYCLILGLSWILVNETWAQKKIPPLGYRIDGEDVVFVFDVRDYQKAYATWGRKVDFADLEIHKISVAGEFNNWSKEGWKLQKVNQYTYELRKKLKDFSGKPTWEYKFVINDQYWAEPPGQAPNRANDWNSHNNLIMTTLKPSLSGNTTFRLEGYEKVHQIFLAGSFNNWNPKQILFGKENGEWVCRINLPEGKHYYKFIVDGNWMLDPENPVFEDDGEGNLNSVLQKGIKIWFRLEGHHNARKIKLAGSFNNWHPEQIDLKYDGEGWKTQITLPKGKYTYKFIVDGKWITDPANLSTEKDRWGNLNSVKLVN
jgi:hypothetical protein